MSMLRQCDVKNYLKSSFVSVDVGVSHCGMGGDGVAPLIL